MPPPGSDGAETTTVGTAPGNTPNSGVVAKTAGGMGGALEARSEAGIIRLGRGKSPTMGRGSGLSLVEMGRAPCPPPNTPRRLNMHDGDAAGKDRGGDARCGASSNDRRTQVAAGSGAARPPNVRKAPVGRPTAVTSRQAPATTSHVPGSPRTRTNGQPWRCYLLRESGQEKPEGPTAQDTMDDE